jgi:thiamine biosynthesis lipoprotein
MIRRSRPLLGTFVEIAAPDRNADAVDAAFSAVAHVHARMSFHEEVSDLAALRRAPVGKPVQVDPETVSVLRVAAMLHDGSAGLFDVTIGAALVAAGYLPRPGGVDLRSMRGTAADIEIIDDNHVVCHRAMLVDLGGIAKGFAVDRAIEVLAAHGVTQAIVNAGGDLRVMGCETVHLRGGDGQLEGSLLIENAALASSSNQHARKRSRNRNMTPHLDRQRLGVVADDAVTIIADTCIIADAMTKIALADRDLADTMLANLGGAVVVRSPAGLAA